MLELTQLAHFFVASFGDFLRRTYKKVRLLKIASLQERYTFRIFSSLHSKIPRKVLRCSKYSHLTSRLELHPILSVLFVFHITKRVHAVTRHTHGVASLGSRGRHVQHCQKRNRAFIARPRFAVCILCGGHRGRMRALLGFAAGQIFRHVIAVE